MNSKEMPTISKTYNCFDDGKITEGRRYEVTTTSIVPFNRANDKLLQLWKDEGLSKPWLFKETDYFIEFDSTESEQEPNGVFARTKKGDWFGLGMWRNCGTLDFTGDLTRYLERKKLNVINYCQVA